MWGESDSLNKDDMLILRVGNLDERLRTNINWIYRILLIGIGR